MKLLQYKVTNFRSVSDSGWIETDDVTTFVGVNESGKSNLLLALWKLNLAAGGEIKPLEDFPLTRYSEYVKIKNKIKFIEADFSIKADTIREIKLAIGDEHLELEKVRFSRFFDGHYDISYDVEIDDENKNELDKQLLKYLPKFIYYSNYGNLSGKIYLEHAIKWLNNQTVNGIQKNEDQIRSLKVLFDFLSLSPEEILDLGKKDSIIGNSDVKKIISRNQEKTDERHVLLHSASTCLTEKFRDWWKQGNYVFHLVADGDYLSIYVSDERRSAQVPLEARSTGLQWFLSFLLIFLVESKYSHKDCILLLDEAGLTLHPHAQKDLAKFFDALSKTNQIIHTTHSPFIVDAAHIDRCRVVSIDVNGYTYVSSDLRNTGNDNILNHSIYALHAALGLNASDVLLHGCKCVIVEGASDQFYLNAIKLFLSKIGKLKINQEIVFVPSGGVKNIKSVACILGGKQNVLPHVLVDSDKSGEDFMKKLKEDLYQGNHERLHAVKDMTKMEQSEVEDLIPPNMIAGCANNIIQGSSDTFMEDYEEIVIEEDRPIIPQIEKHARSNNVFLRKGYKVDLAKRVKRILSIKNENQIEEKYIEMWRKLFELFV